MRPTAGIASRSPLCRASSSSIIAGMSRSRATKRTAGAFFGRRKGHALRPRQAALFETLLPRLALDLNAPAPADLRSLFRRRRRGPARDRLRRRRASDRRGRAPSAHRLHRHASRSSTAWPRRSPRSTQRKLGNIRLHHGDATELLAWLPAARSRASICSIPIRGRSGGTGSAASCRTRASRRSRACCARRRIPLRHRHPRLRRLDACCACCVRRISPGPPSAPTTGASRGRASPARATRPRPCAKAACPAI